LNKAGEPAALDARLHWLLCSLGMAELPIQGCFIYYIGLYGEGFYVPGFRCTAPGPRYKNAAPLRH